MSPVHDPRYSHARWGKNREQEVAASEREARLAWLVPLGMLVVGAGAVMGVRALSGGIEGLSGPALAALYPAGLAFEVAVGVLGLWVAAKLWLGGADTLGLAIVRLAGIYAAIDVLFLVPLPVFVTWVAAVIAYVGLLAWLFDLEHQDAAILAFITFVLKVVVGVGVASIVAYLI